MDLHTLVQVETHDASEACSNGVAPGTRGGGVELLQPRRDERNLLLVDVANAPRLIGPVRESVLVPVVHPICV